MMRHDQQPPSRIVDRILGSRSARIQGETRTLEQGNATYEAFAVTPGFPRMGFTLGVYVRESKGLSVQSHGILFHDVKKPKWKIHEDTEFVSFSHAGEAYTLRGRGLYEFYLALMDCTLQSALEYEPSVFGELEPGAAIIDRVAVTDVADMVRRSREERENRRGH